MNERILQLQIDAMREVWAGNDPDGDVDRMYIPAEFTKKFAKLIVRECARIMDSDDSSYPYDSFGHKLKEHFGVES